MPKRQPSKMKLPGQYAQSVQQIAKSKVSRSAIKEILNYIAETGMLMQMKRTHHRNLGTTFDTVASHSFHTGIIAYCIARMEGLSHEEGLKALGMGILHDVAEARTTDLDFVAKHYTTTEEAKATQDQHQSLPFGSDLINLITEYEDRNTLAAKCVKDADILEQLYQEWVLAYQGNKMAERWMKLDIAKNRIPHLRTESAKQLAYATRGRYPDDWWFEPLVIKKLNKEFLNGKK